MALVVSAVPAGAQLAPDAGAWATAGDRVTNRSAGVSLPTRAGPVALTKTGEASRKGSGLDAIAQYQSDDKAIFATAYIFLAAYPDAALASLATDYAIHSAFGKDVTLATETTAEAGGVPHAAIRRVYRNAALGSATNLVTAAAFVRTGRWMEVLRATGPDDRQRDVEGALDAMLAGTRFAAKDAPLPAAPLTIVAPCPAGDREAKEIPRSKNTAANILAASLIATVPSADGAAPKVTSLAFPRNGAAPVCLRGRVTAGGRTIDILQPADSADGSLALILFSDDGGMLTVEPNALGGGYQVKRYGIAVADVLGSYDAIPNAAQLGAILDGSDRKGSARRARTTLSANGNTNVEIDSNFLK